MSVWLINCSSVFMLVREGPECSCGAAAHRGVGARAGRLGAGWVLGVPGPAPHPAVPRAPLYPHPGLFTAPAPQHRG